MGKIQLTPEELLSQCQEMSSLKNQYESLFQSVDGILNDVNNSWSENLANNFSGKLAAAKNSFSKVTQMLQVGAEITGTSAKTFESVDQQLSALFSDSADRNGLTQSMAGITGLFSQTGQLFKESTIRGKKDLGDLMDIVEQWRDSSGGKKAEGLYGLVNLALGDDSPLGYWKSGYEITEDIVTGDVGWDTFKTFLDASGVSSKVDAVILTGKALFGKDSYYTQRMDELQGDMARHLQEGDILGTAFLMGGALVDVVGKGVVDVGSQLIADTLHLKTINNVIEGFTGVDIGGAINDAADKAGDGISDFIDTGGEVLGDLSENIKDAGSDAVAFVGNVFTEAKDALGDFFDMF